MRFDSATLRFGTRRVIVTNPNDQQYGHLGLEIGMSLAHARRQGAAVCFIKPSNRLGSGLFELESPDVRVLRPTPVVRELFRACLSGRKLLGRIDGWREAMWEQVETHFVREVNRYVDDPAVPSEVRHRLRGVRGRVRSSLEEVTRTRGLPPLYFERQRLRERVEVRLHPEAHKQAAALARAHGIPTDAPLVCVHARERGYKQGREVQDTKHDGRDDGARNARIESYLAAVDELVGRGYTVVRLGDSSMTPVQHPGVVDLATSKTRTNLLEVYCLLRSDLLIAGESGLAGVTYVTNTPFLLVNATEPIAAYPVRAPGLFLPKAVMDRRDGRRLTNDDLLAVDYHRQFRDTRRFKYIDNTPEEIREATREMLEWLSGEWTETPDQRRYHETIVAAADHLRRRGSLHVRKWGLHDGFLGDGRIARVALCGSMTSSRDRECDAMRDGS